MNRQETWCKYREILSVAKKKGQENEAIRELGKQDLFFLLVNIFGRTDCDRDWIFDRCREVQQNPDGYIDLWAREHYKSTIITYALTIKEILNNPEITIGIFSHTRPIAKAFLRQIKRELEGNKKLKALFPDILFDKPQSESPKWSEDDGIVVKRKGNPKEATVEAWGIVDGQPTGRHFALMIYDDLVTKENVTSGDMIKKTNDSWALSLNLGSVDGRIRYIGTYYHFNDTYHEIIARGTARPRIYPATETGKLEGTPILLSSEILRKKRADMGPYIFSCQMLLNPVADENQIFQDGWLQYWDVEDWKPMNRILLCDPASEKKKDSDYTVMAVIGLHEDGNYYLIDMIRDRLSLTERGKALFDLHRKYRPIHQVGYEKYGMQADIEYFKTLMSQQNYRFTITELGGQMPKPDRIKRLVPVFENSKFYIPAKIIKKNYQGYFENLIEVFQKEEYLAFPVSLHDDILDCLSRIEDKEIIKLFPEPRMDWMAGSNHKSDYDPMEGEA